MKLRRIQAIAIGIILLLLCITGCGRKSEDTVQQSDTEQYVSTELPEEGSADSPVENPAETDNRETEDAVSSTPYSEMTTAEKIKTLTVEGCSLPIPCKVEDMGDGLSLGNGITLIGGTICDLMYNDEELGYVTLPEVSLVSDGFEDMSTGYENEWIIIFIMPTFNGKFEIAGVTSSSTIEEIIRLWGEADEQNERQLEYYDLNGDTEERTAYVSFDFYPDGKMMEITIENPEW